MTKSTTRKKAEAKAPEPMDAGAREVTDPVPSSNQQRVCWALKTLVGEFNALFPETPVEYSDYDGRNTALAVTFDLTVLDAEDRETASTLLALLCDPAYNVDPRIAHEVEEDGRALVAIRPGPRTQDVRDPFGLADAYMVLIDAEDGAQ